MDKSNLNGCTNIYANFLVGNGNFQQGMSATDPNAIVYPETGMVIRFTFDVTNPLAIVVTAEDVTDQNLM
jgi:PKD repeat protein